MNSQKKRGKLIPLKIKTPEKIGSISFLIQVASTTLEQV